MRRRMIGALLALALACPATAGRWLVLFEPPRSRSPQVLRAHLDREAAALEGRFKRAPLRVIHRLWIASALAVDVPSDTAGALAADPGVSAIEPDAVQSVPKSPSATATPATTAGWHADAIGAPRVWRELGVDGTGVTIGVIDSGIDASHPALAGKVAAWRDFTETASPTPTWIGGHGTHVAGILAGSGPVRGIAPGARLAVAKVFGEEGAYNSYFLAAMQWMMDPDGDPSTADAPRVVSNSWGSPSTDSKTFWRAVDVWRAAGIFPSFSIGNYGPRPGTAGTPGAYPHVFATGACGPDGTLNRPSSRGPAIWDGVEYTKPDLAAPGLAIVSAWPGGGTRAVSGTSMACPTVSATAALMRQLDPTLTVAECERILRETARDLGPPGPDHDAGAGYLDAFGACRAVLRR